jgi:hypothetical protein
MKPIRVLRAISAHETHISIASQIVNEIQQTGASHANFEIHISNASQVTDEIQPSIASHLVN